MTHQVQTLKCYHIHEKSSKFTIALLWLYLYLFSSQNNIHISMHNAVQFTPIYVLAFNDLWTVTSVRRKPYLIALLYFKTFKRCLERNLQYDRITTPLNDHRTGSSGEQCSRWTSSIIKVFVLLRFLSPVDWSSPSIA